MAMLGIGTSTPTTALNISKGASGVAVQMGKMGKIAVDKPTVQDFPLNLWAANAESLLKGNGQKEWIEDHMQHSMREVFDDLVGQGYLVWKPYDLVELAQFKAQEELDAAQLARIHRHDEDLKAVTPEKKAGWLEEKAQPPKRYVVGRFEESKALAERPEDNVDLRGPVARAVRDGKLSLAGFREWKKRNILYIYWHKQDYEIAVVKTWNDPVVFALRKDRMAERDRWVLREIVDIHAEAEYRRGLLAAGALTDKEVRMNSADETWPEYIQGGGHSIEKPGLDIAELADPAGFAARMEEFADKMILLARTVRSYVCYPDLLRNLRMKAMEDMHANLAVWAAYQYDDDKPAPDMLVRRKRQAEFILSHMSEFTYEALFSGDPAPTEHVRRGEAGESMSEAPMSMSP